MYRAHNNYKIIKSSRCANETRSIHTKWKGFNTKELRLRREGGESGDRRKIHSNYSGSSKV